MLKKAGIVTAAAVALSVVAAPAFAATTPAPQDESPVAVGVGSPAHHHDYISFPEAYRTFIWGGGALGAGAAALVAGAYTGIATTPAEIMGSLSHH